MTVQAMWPTQSPLLQLPSFDAALIEKAKQMEVEGIGDLMNMEEEDRNDLLKISDNEMERLAAICNRLPVVELSYQVKKVDQNDTGKEFEIGESVNVIVTVTRDEEEEEALQAFKQPIYAQFFPDKKLEEWWLIIGHVKSGKVLCNRKITDEFRGVQSVKKKLQLEIEGVDSNGFAEYRLYLICDSYIGCDMEEDIKIKIAQ